jgi:hypothetical protein
MVSYGGFMQRIVLSVAAAVMTASLAAQTAPAKIDKNPIDVRTSASIIALGKTLMAKAQADPTGLAPEILETFPDTSFTELVARTKSGGGEQHAGYSDIFVVLEGDANVVTGGKMIGGKTTGPGEIRGTGLEGGTPHFIHKGDILHIAVGVTHQTKLPEGKTFLYYVIKIPSKMQ